MKKLLSTILAVAGFSLIMAQSATIPTTVKKELKTKFNVTTATWTSTQKYFVASWVDNGQNKTAVYSNSNEPQLVRVETDVDFTTLSINTQNAVTTRFLSQNGQYTVKRSFKVENFSNAVEGVLFNMSSNGVDRDLYIFFDATGNMTSREVN